MTTLASRLRKNPGDPYWNSVSLVLDGLGENNSTSFIDKSKNALAITAFGSAKFSTAQSKFGGSSMYFDGSGDYISAPSSSLFAYGTGDYTVETWFYLLSHTAGTTTRMLGRGSDNLNIDVNGGTNRLVVWVGATYYLTLGVPTLNTWHHVAFSRQSGTVRGFYDGALAVSGTNSTNYSDSTFLAGGGLGSASEGMDGYLQDIRVTKGVARYTAAFTPPQRPFPLH